MYKPNKDPYFLLRENAGWAIFVFGATFALLHLRGIQWSWSLNRYDYLLPLLWLMTLGPLAATFHGSTHGAVGPKLLNRIVGECLGFFFVYGFNTFKWGHELHHKFSGNADLDPDFRSHKTYLGFVLGQSPQVFKAMRNCYIKSFGDSPGTRTQLKLQPLVVVLAFLIKLSFWFVVFGPKYFMLAYLPIAVGNILIFAHINFVTHPIDDPEVKVINHAPTGFFRFLDFMTFGGYNHENHHHHPRAFNHRSV